MKTANLALRFLVELCALAALGYWGFQAGQGLPMKLGLALGAPLITAIIWGVFISPRATIAVPMPIWVFLQIVIFGLATAGLLATGHPLLAGAFALAVIANSILLYAWRDYKLAGWE